MSGLAVDLFFQASFFHAQHLVLRTGPVHLLKTGVIRTYKS
jgi:hypothetical protein